AETGVQGAARFVLALLRERPELRRRFPHALRDGPDGSYCRWLCAHGTELFGLSAAAVAHIEAAFERRAGERGRQIYDHPPHLRTCFPLALSGAGQRSFLRWLLVEGKRSFGLSDEDNWWFLFEGAEDPHHGLVDTYLRTPSWQKRFPLGLTAFGDKKLLAW